jgi:predicted O-methyltransferase YrrM
LRYNPLWGLQPIDVGLPWISFGALDFLNAFLRPQQEVFEYGGGGSTVYFANRTQRVLTMENHPDWHRTLTAALAHKQLNNAKCEFQPISSDELAQFQNNLFFHRIREQLWDVVLIDCYCGYSKTRYGLTRPYAFELAANQIKPGGIIILDDSWMFKDLLVNKPGWRITNYVGAGPCRYGVTSTAIFEKLT